MTYVLLFSPVYNFQYDPSLQVLVAILRGGFVLLVAEGASETKRIKILRDFKGQLNLLRFVSKNQFLQDFKCLLLDSILLVYARTLTASSERWPRG